MTSNQPSDTTLMRCMDIRHHSTFPAPPCTGIHWGQQFCGVGHACRSLMHRLRLQRAGWTYPKPTIGVESMSTFDSTWNFIANDALQICTEHFLVVKPSGSRYCAFWHQISKRKRRKFGFWVQSTMDPCGAEKVSLAPHLRWKGQREWVSQPTSGNNAWQ